MIGALVTRAAIRRSWRRFREEAISGRSVAEDVVMELPGRSGVSGTYRGRPAVQAFWQDIFDTATQFDIRPLRISLAHPYALGFTNTALVQWVAHETVGTVSERVEGVAVVELRHGKIVRSRDYVYDPTALERLWGRREERVVRLG